MKFDWLSYLEVAETLYNEVISTSNQANSASINEAKIRSCISRAYYSAFCLTRNYLRDFEGYSNLKTLKFSVHEYVIEELGNSKKRDFNKLGDILDRLRLSRVEVDYQDMVYFNLISKAKIAIVDAKKVVQLLQKFSSNQKP
ncbi:HEPN domain-containing protein [Dolichospermum sp. FACHB-1091]|uniref:HEPN domain-containing protein n=1 Tax=Dolichospermum sp. FACHB-1091 TaxID=2692798 RepID=UPI00167FE42E|nr:HEPN domain-containing protein [Dolichospermum sp. FACHB-1091]MBD2441675.1 HEPN domain-containing protein [Dolichospermum sp. FACHB-1091]